MGKPTGVGASLLDRRPCAVANPKSAAQIAHEARYTFVDDTLLVADLDKATTQYDVSSALSKAYATYMACPKKKDQKRATKIKAFMHKHKLSLEY